VEKLLVTGKW